MPRNQATTVGTVAPDFTLLDQAERPWTLSEHLDAAIVLVFYRGDW
jgi:peroxiredoxin